MTFDSQDFRQIARELEKYEGVFAKLWEIGRPIFDESIPTACVTFNKVGKFVSFHFNPVFWESLDLKNRCFVICHECLHLILNHGMRMMGLNPSLANTAEDVVINEMLVKKMDFDRADIKDGDKYCWFNTVFTEKKGFPPEFLKTLPQNENFEYYYEIIKKQAKEQIEKALKNGDLQLVDGHEGLEGNDMSDILEEVMSGVSTEELESLKKKLNSLENKENKEFKESEDSKNPKNPKDSKNQQAGTGSGSLVKTIEARKIVKKKKWETIIKKWVKKMMTETEKEIYSFKKKNRRYEYLLEKSNFLLPALLEEDELDRDKKKIDVLFFLDVSGSVYGMETRFFNAAMSIPSDRFNVELFTFDTQVRKVDKKNRQLQIGGGTSAQCISNYVDQNYYSKNKKNVFCYIISDGYFSPFRLEEKHRKNWFWFLVEGGNKSSIHKESNIYDLVDFE